MSIHISAAVGEIAPNVLLAGDPLRAKFIAEKYLENAVKVSEIRNAFFYTGWYKNKQITIGTSGMGCASIGIYSFELYTEYKVESIIRIGTCGSYTSDLKVLDLINASSAASESSYAKFAWGNDEHNIAAQGNAFQLINETAAGLGYNIKKDTVHSSDIFYRKDQTIPAIATKYNCPVVEMESFALFANAAYLNKEAACILTVSDIIPTHEKISPAARETALVPMITLALETVINKQ